MKATREPTQRQRASRGIAALNIIATKFVMLAMVGRRARQLKVPPRDAYREPAKPTRNATHWAFLRRLCIDRWSQPEGILCALTFELSRAWRQGA